jgi:hypothetical protein
MVADSCNPKYAPPEAEIRRTEASPQQKKEDPISTEKKSITPCHYHSKKGRKFTIGG